MMERTAVRSREIAIVGYDRAARVLEVTFRRGGVYRYEDVPEEIYAGLMQAPSQGTYFEEKIKPAYRFSKVS